MADDAFAKVEATVLELVTHIKTATLANQDKEASLLIQQRRLETQAAQLRIQKHDLRAKVETIEIQAAAIRELSTPIMEVWDDVLVVPIIGMVDTQRSVDIMERVLAAIAMQGARCLIIDITGVDTVDTRTADYLIKIVDAAKLLGAFCVITGIGPGVAQTLVALGVDLSGVTTLRNLKQGLRACLRQLAAD
ncbi:MAG: STAS domain-containing protein [Myxococcales bacterium]|nr:STAS domain-containing protein [Myxococcales bacterium]